MQTHSLSATILRRRITGALQSIKSSSTSQALQAITQNTVYSYPTVDLLASYLVELVNTSEGRSEDTSAPVVDLVQSRVDAIERMIAKYGVPKGKVVLVTGSTGNLGSQILAGLLKDERVEKVYALNRPAAAGKSLLQRHVDRFADRGLDVSLLSGKSKVVFVETELAKERLGLEERVYDEVRISSHLHDPY